MLILKNMEELHMGEALRRVLAEQGRSQKWLGTQLTNEKGEVGITPQAVSDMMKAKRFRGNRVAEINSILGIDLNQLAYLDQFKSKDGIVKMNVVDDERINNSPKAQEFMRRLEDVLRAFDELSPEEKEVIIGKKSK